MDADALERLADAELETALEAGHARALGISAPAAGGFETGVGGGDLSNSG